MNSKSIGNMTEAIILAEFVKRSIPVLQPFGDNERYDLVIEINNKFLKIQCKTSKLDDNIVRLTTCSSESHRGGGKKHYKDDIDYFASYCPQLNKCYLIPVDRAACYEFAMRLTPPKSNQVKGINYAADYDFDVQLAVIINK